MLVKIWHTNSMVVAVVFLRRGAGPGGMMTTVQVNATQGETDTKPSQGKPCHENWPIAFVAILAPVGYGLLAWHQIGISSWLWFVGIVVSGCGMGQRR